MATNTTVSKNEFTKTAAEPHGLVAVSIQNFVFPIWSALCTDGIMTCWITLFEIQRNVKRMTRGRERRKMARARKKNRHAVNEIAAALHKSVQSSMALHDEISMPKIVLSLV